ncbi:MAG: hypothetical protein COY75_06985 [Nitrospirae bacterium CG_4_10_14_0_8_um_filter_41_23]|nr:DUF433 domain-containing protein [Nitrospirota bacterium]PIQ94197.1 MAG: hypothetical protein COV68_05820 [Nitrospirae bacterium CG11_big_fil_rev_8_21_14_0_20_41_14]PIV44635.1 MAG: hypothetical protein COS27_01220 [Nitrospirae bacterium CG02_land_8_20_14_3_00_41_53]PIW88102.1 MAG: hypothetical protein COZ94_01560 [Nitrospirae bacterium CG_4_8_14_3_um_filter_41_47]PIY86634.1 MAG: hypothetical protein COY75_06985 [Nitrospirae bacterium CG_4_10_14_0_8_um_filter_41_23]PJA79132.1 MAG: hypothetic
MPTVKGLKHPYIIKKKGVQGGRPVIAGTRIPVSTVIFWYKAGKEIYEILDMYPQLNPSQIHDALSYYYDHKEEMEEEIVLMQNENLWQKRYPSGKGVARTAER